MNWWQSRWIERTLVWLLFVPQEAVVGLKAQLIRRFSQKQNYTVAKEQGGFFGKIQGSLGTVMTLEKLEIELYCQQNNCLVWVFVGKLFFCVPALPDGMQTVLIMFRGTNISISQSNMPFANPLVTPSCLQERMCILIPLNDWHQQTGIPMRAHHILIYDERNRCS